MGKTYNVGPATTFTPLPTAEYLLTVKSWQEVIETEDREYSKKGDAKIELMFTVAVPGAEDATRRVRFAPPASWSTKSTFVHVAEALRLVDHDTAAAEGAQIDWDRAVNLQCIGTIVKKLKQGSTTEFTDSITAYAPLAGQAAAAAPAAGNPIQNRYNALMRFAGEEENTETVVTPGGWATAMKAVGARQMTDHARMELNGIVELLSDMSGADLSDKAEEVTTIREGFVMFGTIEAEVEAMG